MKYWFRIMLIAEVMVIAGLQVTFWSDHEGIQKVWQLEGEIAVQRQHLAEQQFRNSLLSTEVEALKNDSDALEEKARLDLGFIREGETFFQFVK